MLDGAISPDVARRAEKIVSDADSIRYLIEHNLAISTRSSR